MKNILKNIGNQKHKLLQKYGSAEKTVDPAFEALREEWYQLREIISNLQKEVNKQAQESFVKDIGLPLVDISQLMKDFYSEAEYNTVEQDPISNNEISDYAVKYQGIQYQFDAVSKTFLEKQSELQTLVQEYKHRVKSFKKSIKERDDLLVEYDRAKEALRDVIDKNKDSPQVFLAEQKAETSRDAYEKCNEQLIESLSELINHRFADFEPIYKLLVGNQIALFNSVSDAYLSMNSTVNRHDAPPVQKSSSSAPLTTSKTRERSKYVSTSLGRSASGKVVEAAAHPRSTSVSGPSLRSSESNNNSTSQEEELFAVNMDWSFDKLDPCTDLERHQIVNLLSSEKLKSNPYFDKFLALMMDNELRVLKCVLKLACVQVADSDSMIAPIVNLYNCLDGWNLAVIKLLIEYEIKLTKTSATLFRQNSFASKIMYHYSLAIAKDYFSRILEAPIEALCSMAVDKSFEIDPGKASPNENLKENTENLLLITEVFINAIVRADSVAQCPRDIREICQFLRKCVSEKFPQSVDTVVGAFIFLRLVNPLVISPSTNHPEMNMRAKRALILVTKILQNIANSVVDTGKEEYMKPISQFTALHLTNIKQYFTELSDLEQFQVPPGGSKKKKKYAHSSIQVSTNDLQGGILKLYSKVYTESEKICRMLNNFGHSDIVPELEEVLKNLGPPPLENS
mmetsp:Transcript_9315/g.12829  ORF Transcript_9315/g.12829 Transcript_9315/m.12829 type:complete len:683 (-) Transcript_9315:211-2259(-)